MQHLRGFKDCDLAMGHDKMVCFLDIVLWPGQEGLICLLQVLGQHGTLSPGQC